ncbi:MAG: hypothetical protein ABI686_01720 [Acidobacteriota bacterium]
MKRKIINLFTFALLTIGLTATLSVQAQTRPYRVSDRNVQYLLNRIETRTDTYKNDLNRALDNSRRLNGTDTEDTVLNYVKDFENSTDALKQKFGDKNSVIADVEDVLNRGAYINQFMKNNRLDAVAQRSWANIRTDLTTLARYYSINGDWTNPSTVNTATVNPYRVNDNTVKILLSRIETKTDNYKRVLNNALDRSRLNGSDSEDMINNYVTEFENSTDSLKRKFDDRQSANADVTEVLNRAYYIDNFMRQNRLAPNAERQWQSLRADLQTLANYYNVSFNFNVAPVINNNNTTTGGLPYRVNENNVRTLLSRIEQRTDAYKRNMNTALDRSVLNNTRSEETLYSYITDFEKSTDSLKQNFDARRSTTADVEEVLNRAYFINGFMRDYRFTPSAEGDWNLLRADLNTLSNYYSVNFDFDKRQYVPMSKFDAMLTGTYRLNTAQSDNVGEVVGRAISSYYGTGQQDRIQKNLERRLTSPDVLAIEKRDKQVTVGSSSSPQITFTADNVARTETTNNGRSIKVTANTYYDGVALNYEGDRINDFYVNFVPMNNGQLKVVRRVYLENRNETVTVASVYDKTNDTAQFYNLNNGNTTGGVQNDNFVVPNNTQLITRLTTAISTKASQNGDKFLMEVTSPSQYNGAIIEGRVTKAERSGQVSGRANVSLEFDTIRLRNGQTYKFAGIVDNVKLASGENVTVNNEGSVRDNNQTTKTVQRAGIGAALGALIGAIAGGGSGAAIGAAVGAGAGAGTVLIQGRDDVELDQGSEFTITATAPSNVNRY